MLFQEKVRNSQPTASFDNREQAYRRMTKHHGDSSMIR
jgi:hypothetical protein